MKVLPTLIGKDICDASNRITVLRMKSDANCKLPTPFFSVLFHKTWQ